MLRSMPARPMMCPVPAPLHNRVEHTAQHVFCVFGALRKSVFSSTSVSFHAKKAVYETLVLAIMLFGSESWCQSTGTPAAAAARAARALPPLDVPRYT